MFQNKNKIIISSIFLFGILVLSVFLFWKGNQYFAEKKEKAKQENVRKEVDAIMGDYLKNLKPNGYEASGIVVNKLEDLLKNNKDLDPSTEALIKNYLGDNYLATDFEKGLELLKEIIKNNKYNNADRAIAIYIVLDYYEMYPYRTNKFFSGYFFDNFLKDNDSATAFYRLNELAQTLSPSVVTSYRIALYWTNKIELATSEDQKNESYKKAVEILVKADPYTFQLDNEKKWVSESRRGIVYKIRSRVLENLYFYSKQNFPIEQVKDSYKQSISVLETSPVDRYMFVAAPYSRFFYASFLAKVDSQKYSEEIKNVLAPICDPSSYGKFPIYRFFEISLMNQDKQVSIAQQQRKEAVERLVQVDSDFKELIEKIKENNQNIQ